MSDSKKAEKTQTDYDYLSNAASTTDCTGLIPSLPQTDAELESYNDIYRFYPPNLQEKKAAVENSPQ